MAQNSEVDAELHDVPHEDDFPLLQRISRESNAPSGADEFDFSLTAFRKAKKSKSLCMHSARLTSALDALKSVLLEISSHDPQPPAADTVEDATANPSASDDDDSESSSLSETRRPPSDSSSSIEGDGVDQKKADDGTHETNKIHNDGSSDEVLLDLPTPGAILSYQQEVLQRHDGEYPPLSTLKRSFKLMDAPLHSIPILGDLMKTVDSRAAQLIEVINKRLWLELPDDLFTLHCLLNGMDPALATSRKTKKKWFEGKPIYSPAVMFLSQISQQQFQAMKKKHAKKSVADEANGESGTGTAAKQSQPSMNLDPPLLDEYKPFPKLANGYFDNDVFPLGNDDVVTPPTVAELLLTAAEMFTVSNRSGRRRSKGSFCWRRSSSIVGRKGSATDEQEAEKVGFSLRTTNTIASAALLGAPSTHPTAVVSVNDVALAFSLFPQNPALQLAKPKLKPKEPKQGGRRESDSEALFIPSAFAAVSFDVTANSRLPQEMRPTTPSLPKYTMTWIEQWQQQLLVEERRYANPKTAATMYQALTLVHPNGTECRLWVVKRLIRWIMKAKRSLLRFTVLRARLLFSARKPQSECSHILVPVELEPQHRTPEVIATPRANFDPMEEHKEPVQEPAGETVAGSQREQENGDPAANGDPAPEASAVPPPPEEEELEVAVDPLPLQDSGGLLLVRSSARHEILTGERLPLPAPLLPSSSLLDPLSEQAKDAFRTAVSLRTNAEVIMNVVVTPTFDPLTQRVDDDAGAMAPVSSETRTSAPDSFIEILSSKFCEAIIALESDFRVKKQMARELAVEIHKELLEQQRQDNGRLILKKKKHVRNDGVQLGLIKSSAALEAQERANPLTSAIHSGLSKLRDFVVNDVLIAPKATKKDTSELHREATDSKGGAAAPGIVSLREVLTTVFRDSYRTRPQWINENGTADKTAKKELSEGAEQSAPQDEEQASALWEFLKPILRIAPTSLDSDAPVRLLHQQQMNFAENLHTFDDNSLFNLRRRERCSTRAELLEEISELFHRLVEAIHNVDVLGDEDDDRAPGKHSNAATNRRARKGKPFAQTPREAQPPPVVLGGASPKVPRKQFGTILRVLIDRMVRRLFVAVVSLLRTLFSNGKSMSASILEQILASSPSIGQPSVGPPLGESGEHQPGPSTPSMSLTTASAPPLGSCEPTFSILTERVAQANGGPGPHHHFIEMLEGWRWVCEDPSTVEIVWGAGKEQDSDKDRLTTRIFDEMKQEEQRAMLSYTAFSESSFRVVNGAPVPGSGSILRQLGESLKTNLAITSPIAVAECCNLDADELDQLCGLFPTPSENDSGSNRVGDHASGGGTLGDFFSQKSHATMSSASTHVGEDQFVFTVLHILDLCHFGLEAEQCLELDGAAHLRHEGGGEIRKIVNAKQAASKLRSKVPKSNSGSSHGQFEGKDVLDVRDSMFFRWNFFVKINASSFVTDVRHCMLTLFEKQVAKDIISDSLLCLKMTMRQYYVDQDEVVTVKQLEQTRIKCEEEELLNVGSKAVGLPIMHPSAVVALSVFSSDDKIKEAEQADALVAYRLQQRQHDKVTGLAFDSERQLRRVAIFTRLRMAIERFNGEKSFLMAGVRELLEQNPPSDKDCFRTLQTMFKKEFEKWEAHRSLMALAAAPVPTISPSGSKLFTPRDSSQIMESSVTSTTSLMLPKSSVPRRSDGSESAVRVIIPTDHRLDSGSGLPTPTSTPTATLTPKSNVTFGSGAPAQVALRCEKCHQLPTGVLYRHKDQPVKKVVPLTDEEVDVVDAARNNSSISTNNRFSVSAGPFSDVPMFSSPTASRTTSIASISTMPPSATTAIKKSTSVMRRQLTKIITQYTDIFVCSKCMPLYLSNCLIKKLIDVLHAAQAQAAEAAAAAAAEASEKLKHKIQEELFGAAFGVEEVTAEVFEQVQDTVRRKEADRKKKGAVLHGEDSDDDDDGENQQNESDEDEEENRFGPRRAKKKKHKKKPEENDDDLYAAIAPAKVVRKKRNFLEDKLADVMQTVQKESIAATERKERRDAKKEETKQRNKLTIEFAKGAFIIKNGYEPTSLDELLEGGTELVQQSDEEETEEDRQFAKTQAEADKLMGAAAQKGQSKLGMLKKAVAQAGRSAAVVKIVGGGEGKGKAATPVTGSRQGQSGQAASIASTFASPLKTSQEAEVDEFGLPLLRSKSGLSIAQLEDFIVKEEENINNNKLEFLKKDLEAKVVALEQAKKELADLLQQYQERCAAQEAEREAKIKALQEKVAAEKLKKKAAQLRAVAEKFKGALKKHDAPEGSVPIGVSQSDSRQTPNAVVEAAELTDEQILQLAKDAAAQQAALTNRLVRGESRRILDPAIPLKNLLEDDDIFLVSHPTGDGAGDIDMLLLDGRPSRQHMPQDDDEDLLHVDVWRVPAVDARFAMRTLCRLHTQDSNLMHAVSPMAVPALPPDALCVDVVPRQVLQWRGVVPIPDNSPCEGVGHSEQHVDVGALALSSAKFILAVRTVAGVAAHTVFVDSTDEALTLMSPNVSTPNVTQEPTPATLLRLPVYFGFFNAPPVVLWKSKGPAALDARVATGAIMEEPKGDKPTTVKNEVSSSPAVVDNVVPLPAAEEMVPSLYTSEWFNAAESDDVMQNRDDALLLMQHLARLDPLSYFYGNEETSPGDQLRFLIVQCAFVEESVCALLDMACFLVKRIAMHDDHLEGYPCGTGGAMLELYGIPHPATTQLYNALGAPTSSAAIALSMRQLKESMRTNVSLADGVGAKGFTSTAPKRFVPEFVFGDTQKQLLKFTKGLLSVTRPLRKKCDLSRAVLKYVPLEFLFGTKLPSSAPPLDVEAPPSDTSDGDNDADDVQKQQGEAIAEAALDLVAERDRMAHQQMILDSTISGTSSREATSAPPADSMNSTINSVPGNFLTGEALPTAVEEAQTVSPWATIGPNVMNGLPTPTDTAPTSPTGARRRKSRVSITALEGDTKGVSSTDQDDGDVKGKSNRSKSLFRERIGSRVSAQAASNAQRFNEDRYLGCLAEVVLPPMAFFESEGSTTPTAIAQAWWQARLVAIASYRFFIAKSFLSFRSLWMYSRRILARQLQQHLPKGSTIRDQQKFLITCFGKPYYVEPPTEIASSNIVTNESSWQDQDAAGPEPLTTGTVAEAELASSLRGNSSAAIESSVSNEFLREPASLSFDMEPPDPKRPSLAPTDEVLAVGLSSSQPPAGACSPPAGACSPPAGACSPLAATVHDPHSGNSAPQAAGGTKKYLKHRKLSLAESRIKQHVVRLYHSHLFLAHAALEEYSAGLLKSYASIDGASLLAPRDCLRLANTSVLKNLRSVILHRAADLLDAVTPVAVEDGDIPLEVAAALSKCRMQFVEDLGRLALALFVLGPLQEARSVLSLAGFDSFNVDKDRTDDIGPIVGSIADAFEAVQFTERQMFLSTPRAMTSGGTQDGAKDKVPVGVTKQSEERDHDEERTLLNIAEEPHGEFGLQGWETEDVSVSANTSPRKIVRDDTLPSSTEDHGVSPKGNSKQASKKKPLHELSEFEKRILRSVFAFMHTTPPGSNPGDVGLLQGFVDSAVYSFFFHVSRTELVAFGVQLALFALSAGLHGADNVLNETRLVVPLASLAEARHAENGLSAARQRDLIASLARGVLNLDAALAVEKIQAAVGSRPATQPEFVSTFGSDSLHDASVFDNTLGSTNSFSSRRQSRGQSRRRPTTVHFEGVADSDTVERDVPHAAGSKIPESELIATEHIVGSLNAAMLYLFAELQLASPKAQPEVSHKEEAKSLPVEPTTVVDPSAPEATFADTFESAPSNTSVVESPAPDEGTLLKPDSSPSPQRVEVSDAAVINLLSRHVVPQLLPLAASSDPCGGSSVVLFRHATEKLSATQLQRQEEIRRRQRHFNGQMYAVIQELAPVEEKLLFASVGLEAPSSGNAASDVLRRALEQSGDEDDVMRLEGRESRNPLDALKTSSKKVNQTSINNLLQEQLRDALFDEVESPTDGLDDQFATSIRGMTVVGGQSPIAGAASSPFKNSKQVGSLRLQRLVQKASQSTIVQNDFNFNRTIGSDSSNAGKYPGYELNATIRSTASNELSRPSTVLASPSNRLTAIRRMSVALNTSLGENLPTTNNSNNLNAVVDVVTVYNELDALLNKVKSRRVLKEAALAASPKKKVTCTTFGFFDDADDGKDEVVMSMLPIGNKRRTTKEITEQNVRRVYRKQASEDAFDLATLLKTSQKQPHEFFVPVLSTACQLMNYSDKTRTEFHDCVPPQWVEECGIFIVIALVRHPKTLNAIVKAAFLHDLDGSVSESTEPEDIPTLFNSYQPQNVWNPPKGLEESSPRPLLPWVECTISKKKGIFVLDSPLGCYRMTEQVLHILIAAAEAPRIHVQKNMTPIDIFTLSNMDNEGHAPDDEEKQSSDEQEGMAARVQKTGVDAEGGAFSSIIGDAALSVLLKRKAMLRNFLMPSHTGQDHRESYSPQVPYDPRRRPTRIRTPVDWSVRFQVHRHEQPSGLNYWSDEGSARDDDESPSKGRKRPTQEFPMTFLDESYQQERVLKGLEDDTNIDISSYEVSQTAAPEVVTPPPASSAPHVRFLGPLGRAPELSQRRTAEAVPTAAKESPPQATPHSAEDSAPARRRKESSVVTKWSQLLPHTAAKTHKHK